MERKIFWAILFILVAIVVVGVAMNSGGDGDSEPRTSATVEPLGVSATDFAWRVSQLDQLQDSYIQTRDPQTRLRLLEWADQLSVDLSMGRLSKDQAEVAYLHLDLTLRMMGLRDATPHELDLRDRISIVTSTYLAQQEQTEAIDAKYR